MDWKIGDEFKIINPAIDSLGPNFGPYKVAKLVPDVGDNGSRQEGLYHKRVWFKINDSTTHHQYASRENIRKLTKLEKALK